MELKSARPAHPSKTLQREIEARNWSVENFCSHLNDARKEMKKYSVDEWNIHTTQLLLDDHFSISDNIAENLSICFDTHETFWSNLMTIWMFWDGKNK